MEILSGIVVGAIAGGLAAVVCRSANIGLTASMAVGILGGLLGLASNFWLDAAVSADLASFLGATLTLFLWIVAQRLFFGNPSERVIGD